MWWLLLCRAVEQRVRAALAAREGEPVATSRGTLGLDDVRVDRGIVDRFPEVNPSNYDHEAVCALNAWGLEVVMNARPVADAAPPAPSQDEVTIWFDGGRLLVRIDESPWTEWLEPALVSIAGGKITTHDEPKVRIPPRDTEPAPSQSLRWPHDDMGRSECESIKCAQCDGFGWLAAPPAPSPCPHIRSSGTGEWATNWCALNGVPQEAREAMRAALTLLDDHIRDAEHWENAPDDAVYCARDLLRAALGE